MKRRWVVSLALVLLTTGCATARVVRLDTGRGEPLVLTPRTDDTEPVELEEEELQGALAELSRDVRPSANPQQAARRLFEVEARSGSYLFNPRTHEVAPVEGTSRVSDLPSAEVELTRAYLRWCERTGRRGDCLSLLVEGPTVNGDGRYALAMALAQGAVLEEMLEAFKDMANPHAMLAAALWTGTTYFILMSLPEPVSKGLAAVMTATLIVYLGVDTFWGLMTGFKRLVEEADRATTFDELRGAGERYGKVMGRNAARAFALLATAAIGNTAAGFASKVPTLPGSAQASMQAGAQAGIQLSAVGQVEAVAVTGEAITLSLAPGAVAMAARGMGAGAAGPVDAQGHDHHIATDKWWDSTDNGGPWSPQFQKVFDKAGMSLNDPANIVRVRGHRGPHPQEYHQRILDRLFEATKTCRSVQHCREALTSELRRLARQISTEGTELNRLVTRSE
ncbi:AHH domain-containing protein [Archangium sp.]|jgi:hypothetical protein|uniref:SitA5 family polymorphic toxin n=1 Tax=Archangium sp. TaxID=1872627 RepID=UPI002ED8A3CB